MYPKGQTVIQVMERLAPKSLAVPDDRIGLQLGTLDKEVRTIMTALDVTEAVVQEAIDRQADLIIAHHAIIFRPLKTLRTDLAAGRLYELLIKHDIAVYIAHTNLDIADGGINDMMAQALDLKHVSVMDETWREPLYKFVVFVPASHAEAVSQAIFAAGAGHIGNYSGCSFRLEGTGTFLPGEGTNPYIGRQGKVEEVREIRLETIAPQSALKQVTAAMRRAHPYEEPAYDIYPLELEGKRYGLGRVGLLPQEMTLRELAERVKIAFDVPALRVVGPLDQTVRKAAVLGGSGGRYVQAARMAGAEVLITGDIDYHTAQDALADGMCLIDPGHNAEKIMKRGVADYLRRELSGLGYKAEVFPSELDTEPFRFL